MEMEDVVLPSACAPAMGAMGVCNVGTVPAEPCGSLLGGISVTFGAYMHAYMHSLPILCTTTALKLVRLTQYVVGTYCMSAICALSASSSACMMLTLSILGMGDAALCTWLLEVTEILHTADIP